MSDTQEQYNIKIKKQMDVIRRMKKNKIIGKAVRSAYEGSHLEGKPCSIWEIQLGGYEDDK